MKSEMIKDQNTRKECWAVIAGQQVKSAVGNNGSFGKTDNILKAMQPTQAQIEAGNYKKRKVSWRGLNISIENEKGSIRRGTDPSGHEWAIKTHYAYGYIRGTEASDGEQVDCYLGANEGAENVYIVHQRKSGKWDQYDEDKAMLGFDSEEEAKKAYLKQYDDPRFLGPITTMPFDEFKEKVLQSTGKMIKSAALPIERALIDGRFNLGVDAGLLKTHVSAYTKKDGTFVSSHEDARPQSMNASGLDGLRKVDVFGNGGRVDYYDDKKGLMYSKQRFPTGIVRWTVFDVFPGEDGGNSALSDVNKYKSFEEARDSVRGLRISAALKANEKKKYGAIPRLWDGEGKRVAKALIDAGIDIDRFASSSQSTSKYIYLESGIKIRLANHDLPVRYDSADIDYRYGGDINGLVEKVKNADAAIKEDEAPRSDSDLAKAIAWKIQMQERQAVRADESGLPEEPAQSMFDRGIDIVAQYLLKAPVGGLVARRQGMFLLKSYVKPYVRAGRNGNLVQVAGYNTKTVTRPEDSKDPKGYGQMDLFDGDNEVAKPEEAANAEKSPVLSATAQDAVASALQFLRQNIEDGKNYVNAVAEAKRAVSYDTLDAAKKHKIDSEFGAIVSRHRKIAESDMALGLARNMVNAGFDSKNKAAIKYLKKIITQEFIQGDDISKINSIAEKWRKKSPPQIPWARSEEEAYRMDFDMPVYDKKTGRWYDGEWVSVNS